MDDREKDIQQLCRQALKAAPNVYHNSNGADISTCPFCRKEIEYAEYNISEIKHDRNCAYLIAKDLSTGINIT